ncbi:MAG: diaminobutyrate acetyltransferase [Pseudomonadota bacterium]
MVKACPPLDVNSMYCNLIQATHFRDSCIVAESDEGELLGFVTGHRPPSDPEGYFVWQVATAENARGLGLAKKMIKEILAREEHADARYLLATVTPDNIPSRAMFQSLADGWGVALVEEPFFEKDTHFMGQHESEVLIRIGPFK